MECGVYEDFLLFFDSFSKYIFIYPFNHSFKQMLIGVTHVPGAEVTTLSKIELFTMMMYCSYNQGKIFNYLSESKQNKPKANFFPVP